MAHYSATKTMQLSISRSLAELTKNTRVTVNTVLPGSTRTESVETFMQDVFPGLRCADAEKRFIAENRPTSLPGRLIDPERSATSSHSSVASRNQAESVLSDVRRIRAHPLVPASVPVYGYIYDVKNGRLVEVPEASKAGRAA